MATFGTKYNEGPWQAPNTPKRDWPVTPSQIRYLLTLGYEQDPTGLTRGEASGAITLLRSQRKKRA